MLISFSIKYSIPHRNEHTKLVSTMSHALCHAYQDDDTVDIIDVNAITIDVKLHVKLDRALTVIFEIMNSRRHDRSGSTKIVT